MGMRSVAVAAEMLFEVLRLDTVIIHQVLLHLVVVAVAQLAFWALVDAHGSRVEHDNDGATRYG